MRLVRDVVGRAVGLVALLAGAAATAAAQAPDPAPLLKVNAAEIEIGGRVQTQFNTTSAEGEPGSEVILRRVRLEARVKVNEVVSGKVQPDFAGDRVSVKDAYLRLDLHPAFAVLAGKTYRPFSLLEQTSSTRILPIERGAALRGVDALDEYELVSGLAYSDRDIGIQLIGSVPGAPLGLRYQAGVFRGPLQGRVGDEASYQYAARGTVRPLDDLTVGLAWSNRHFARPAADGATELERGNAFEVDAEYGAFDPGVHLLAELAVGDFDPFTGDDFLGAQAWLGYRTPPVGRLSTIEPILRLSHGDVDSPLAAVEASGGTLVTPGVNLYFGGLNRLMLNYDLWRSADSGSEGSFKAQFQLAF